MFRKNPLNVPAGTLSNFAFFAALLRDLCGERLLQLAAAHASRQQ
jgi:hypothetical protein